MSDFFNKNSRPMRFLSNVANIMIINLFFIISSIPIITMGAALSTSYRLIFMILEGEDVFLFRDYSRFFVSSFKNSTLIWIPTLLAMGLFGYEVFMIATFMDQSYKWFLIPIFIVLFAFVSLFYYAFPMTGLYKQSIKQTVKNSLILSVSNAPVTIMFIAIDFLVIFLSYKSFVLLIVFLSVYMFFGFALAFLIKGYFLRKIFLKHGDVAPDYDDTETGRDNEN